MSSNPYLSIVAVTRNDDHGGNLLARLGAFCRKIEYGAKNWNVPIELVLVEWNPPSTKETLSQLLPKILDDRYCSIRVVSVPSEFHKRLHNPFQIPLFQMIGKNVGIARARGEFILSTCNDIILSDAFFKFLSETSLSEHCLYRTDRVELGSGMIPHTIRPVDYDAFCLDTIEGYSGGYDSSIPTMHEERNPEIIPIAKQWQICRRGVPHTNASGDFTLMHQSVWKGLRGHPELALGDGYIDGLMVYLATMTGIQPMFLRRPICAFHLKHDLSFGDTEGKRKRMERRPSLDYDAEYTDWCRDMVENGALNTNSTNWGFGDVSFEEKVV
jgi:hypothetical protein